ASYVDAEWSSGLSPDVKSFVHGYLRTADNPYEMVQIRALQGCKISDTFGAALIGAADEDAARVQLLDAFLGRAAASDPLERDLERLYDEAMESEEEEDDPEEDETRALMLEAQLKLRHVRMRARKNRDLALSRFAGDVLEDLEEWTPGAQAVTERALSDTFNQMLKMNPEEALKCARASLASLDGEPAPAAGADFALRLKVAEVLKCGDLCLDLGTPEQGQAYREMASKLEPCKWGAMVLNERANHELLYEVLKIRAISQLKLRSTIFRLAYRSEITRGVFPAVYGEKPKDVIMFKRCLASGLKEFYTAEAAEKKNEAVKKAAEKAAKKMAKTGAGLEEEQEETLVSKEVLPLPDRCVKVKEKGLSAIDSTRSLSSYPSWVQQLARWGTGVVEFLMNLYPRREPTGDIDMHVVRTLRQHGDDYAEQTYREALEEQDLRTSLENVAMELEQQGDTVLVSVGRDSFCVAHPDGPDSVTDEWIARVQEAGSAAGAVPLPTKEPQEILDELKRAYPELHWNIIDADALEMEMKRLELASYMRDSPQCPELLLSEVLVSQLVRLGDRELRLSEVYRAVQESPHSYSLAVWDDSRGRWTLRTKDFMETSFKDKVKALAQSIWTEDLGFETRLPNWATREATMKQAAESAMKRLLDPEFNEHMDSSETRRFFLFDDGYYIDRETHSVGRCTPDLIITRCSAMKYPFEAMSGFETGGVKKGVKDFLVAVSQYERQVLVYEGVQEDSYPPAILEMFDALLARLLALRVLYSMWKRPAVVVFMLKLLAARMFAREGLEEFYFFQGPGGNGKGLLTFYLEHLLGTYHQESDYSLFCTNMDPAKASPQVVAIRARRIVSIPESETSQQLKSKTVKLWRDQTTTITCRSLFKDDIRFNPHFAMIFSTNNRANFSALDGGVQRSLCVIPFPVSFVDREPVGADEARVDITLKTPQTQEVVAPELLMLLTITDEIFYKDGVGGTTVQPQPKLVKEAKEQFVASEHQHLFDAFRDKRLTTATSYRDASKETEIRTEFVQFCSSVIQQKHAANSLLNANMDRVTVVGQRYLRLRESGGKGFVKLKQEISAAFSASSGGFEGL
ncbi:unnamed protein product, partial [Symbiodinium sp. CCMP2592]